MTKTELYSQLKEADKEIEDHIKMHHQGDNAGVLKLTNYQKYRDLISNCWAIRNMIANRQYEE